MKPSYVKDKHALLTRVSPRDDGGRRGPAQTDEAL